LKSWIQYQIARELFAEVLQLTMLIVALPISTCESERTFSALKRLKTYLRSTMSQDRLNGIALANVHSTILNEEDSHQLMNDFIKKSQIRINAFEIFK
jgi:hypothetical protein